MDLKEVVKKTDGKDEWCVISHTGKSLGCYGSQAEADKRLKQVEMFKHMKESQVLFSVLEATKEGTVWKVAVIERGKSYNKTVYSDKALADIQTIINEADKNGAPIKCNAFQFEETLNHLPGKARGFMQGFAENIVGWFKNAVVEGGRLVAELHLDEGAEKIRSLLTTAFKKGIAHPFGLSIDGEGDVQEGHDGQESVLNVIAVNALNSIDCVTHPSAGGKFLAIVESMDEEKRMFKPVLEIVSQFDPKLVEGIDMENVNLETTKKVLAEMGKREPRFVFELTDANVAECAKKFAEVVAAIAEECKAAKDKKEKKEREMQEELKKAQEDLAKLKESMEAQKVEMDKTRCDMLLNKVLSESALPDLFKDTIRDEFKGKVFDEKTLREKVAAMEKTVVAFKEGQTSGSQRVSVITEERDKKLGMAQDEMDKLCGTFEKDGKLVESARGRWGNSIRKAYIDMTGDEDVSGRVSARAKSRIAESITSGDFPELLANSMTKRLVREYANGDAMYRQLCRIVPIRDFKTQDRPAWGEFPDIAIVTEGVDYNELSLPTEEKATYTPAKRGNFIGITREAIINDDLNAFANTVPKVARATLRTLNKFVFDVLLNVSGGVINAGTIYDAKALYHNDHANITTDPLSYSALDAALTAMWNQKDMDGKLELGIVPKFLVIPRELRSTAIRIINTERMPGDNFNDVNPVWKTVEPLIAPYLRGDKTNWYLLADPMKWDGIELGFVGGAEAPALITANAEGVDTMFIADKIRYKVRHEYGAGVLDYRPFYGGIVA